MPAAARSPLRPHGRRRSRGSGFPQRVRAGGILAVLTLPAILGLGCLHTELKESDPAEDAVLTESPSRITLTYTTDVQLALSSVEVHPAPPGATPAPAGKLAYLADDRHDVIVLPLSEPLGGGGYTVSWTTAGPDGHKLSGDFGFRVELPVAAESREPPELAETDADPATPPGATATPPPGDAPGVDRSQSAAGGGTSGIGVLIGFLFYLGIVGILGGVVFRSLVLGRCARGGAPREWIDSVTAETSLFFSLPLGFLVATAILRLWDRTRTFFPDDVAGNLLTVATGTPWAAGWWLHLVCAVLVGWGVLFRKEDRIRPGGWKVITVGALLLPVVPVLSGHGWSDGPRAVSAVATYLHVVAAAGWMGALGCLLRVHAGLPGGGDADSPASPGLAEMVAAFSRVAQVAVAVLLVTGALKIWTHIDAASELWTTPWGRSLLVKAGVVAGVMALGFYNWRVVRPRLERGAGSAVPAVVELLLGVAAVAVTSFLVTQPLN